MSITVGPFVELRSLPASVLQEQATRPFHLPAPAYPGQSHDGLLSGLSGASLIRHSYSLGVPPMRLLHYVIEQGSFLVGHRLDGVVLTADGRPIHHTAAFRDRQEVGQQPGTVVETGAPVQLDEVFVGFDGAWRNYFHFLCFAVVKSAIAARVLDPSVAIAMPDYAANTVERTASFSSAVYEQALADSGLSDRVTLLRPGAYRARRLHVLWTDPAEPTDIMHLDAFQAVFDRIAQGAMAQGAPPAPPAQDAAPGRRLYLARSRHVASRLDDGASALIDEAAARHGFERIGFETLDLRQQIATIRQASHLISPHGAGLCNILFGRKSLKVLELNRPLDGGTRLRPWFLLAARSAGLSYGYVDTADPGFSAERIDAALSRLVANP